MFIHIFMLTFLHFLKEDLLLESKYLYGINHTDSGAWKDIIKLSEILGYKTNRGSGGHVQVHHPETGERITTISIGSGGLKRHRDALKHIHDHQMSIGGFSGIDHTIKTIKKSL